MPVSDAHVNSVRGDSLFPDDGVAMADSSNSHLLRHSLTSTGHVASLRQHTLAATTRPARNARRELFSLRLACAITLGLFAVSLAPAVSAGLISLTNTNVTECVSTNLTWTGGSPPFKLRISPIKSDGNSDPTRLQTYQNLPSPFFLWTVNFTENTSLQFDITDANGDQSGGLPVTVLAGSDTSCLGTVSSTVSGGASTTDPSSATTSGSPSQSARPIIVTGLSAGAIAGIAVGVGVIAVIITAATSWCLLKRLLRKRRRLSGIHTPSPSSSSNHVSTDGVRISWYKRAGRRMSPRANANTPFDIDRAVSSPTSSEDAPTIVMQQRPHLPSLAYRGITDTLATTEDPFKPPSPTDSLIVSGPSSPISDRGEVNFLQTPYTAPSLPQHSTTSLSDAQSQSRKARKATHAHNASNTSNMSNSSTNVSSPDLRSPATSPTLSTALTHSSGDRQSRRDRDTSTLASTVSSPRSPRTPRTPRHETDAGIRLLPVGPGYIVEGEGESGSVAVVSEQGDGAAGESGLPPPYSIV